MLQINSRTETKQKPFSKILLCFGGFPISSFFFSFFIFSFRCCPFFFIFLLLLQRERHRKQNNQKKQERKNNTKEKTKRNNENTKKMKNKPQKQKRETHQQRNIPPPPKKMVDHKVAPLICSFVLICFCMVLDFWENEKEPKKTLVFSVFLHLLGEDVSDKQQNRNKRKCLFQNSSFVLGGGFLSLSFSCPSLFLLFVVALFSLFVLLLLQRERHRKQHNQKNKRGKTTLKKTKK